ncbi:Small Integral Membrane Protein 24 [Manis pentadactyla]|nr:Small Integral Membrane Protein 24 [Manis pentadactyla]
MDRLQPNPFQLSLLAALVLGLVQAQPLVQRKPWLVGLGSILAFLFLVFILAVVYAVWCSESHSSGGACEQLESQLPCCVAPDN